MLTYLLPEGIQSQKLTEDLLDHHGVVVKPFDPVEFDPQKPSNAVRISFWPWTREDEITRLMEGIDEEMSTYGPLRALDTQLAKAACSPASALPRS
jgi:hypothetical protein